MNLPRVIPTSLKQFLNLAYGLATLLTTLLIANAEEITLAWDPNPEPDVIGYKVHYGGESRAYGQVTDVGNTTLFTTPSLVQGSTYFFAVTAYNTAGLESEYSSEVQYTVPVTGVGNQVPIASDSSVETLQDQSVSFRLDATDPDGDSLTFTLLTPPSHGSLSGTAPNLTYTPLSGYHGADSFTFKASDGALDSDPATVSIAVADVNQPPVAFAQSVSTAQDTPVAVSLKASDPDGDDLAYTLVSGPSHGTLGGAAPNLTYTPQSGYHGSDSFTFKVNDGLLDSQLATVSIAIIDGDNTPPTAINAGVTTTKNSPVTITLRGTDAEGDQLTCVVVKSPANGTLNGNAPTLTYTPNSGYSGPDSFTFKVNDGQVDSLSAIVSITVEHSGGGSSSREKKFKTQESTPLDMTLAADTAQGGSLTYQLITFPAYGTLEGNAPNLTYTPVDGFVGEDNFQYLVSDGSKSSIRVTVTISVVGASLSISPPSMPGDGVRLTWPAAVGETYRILYKINLSDPVWMTASPDLIASESILFWVDTTAPQASRFYRLTRVEP